MLDAPYAIQVLTDILRLCGIELELALMLCMIIVGGMRLSNKMELSRTDGGICEAE